MTDDLAIVNPTHFERERLVLLEFNEQERMPVVYRHQFALGVSVMLDDQWRCPSRRQNACTIDRY